MNTSCRRALWLLRGLTLLFVAGALYAGYRAQGSHSEGVHAGISTTPVSAHPGDMVPLGPGYAGKPIEQIQLGDRVLGRNPIREQAEEIEPDPATWRHVSLYMEKEGGEGLWIELLRPLSWIENNGAEVGVAVYLELPEMGAIGDAEVLRIKPCPEISPGSSGVVTGIFKHQANEDSHVVRLELEGQIEPTYVTSNHAYWSADRRDFVEIAKFRDGECIDTGNGIRHVIGITPVSYSGCLVNLETTEHVYRVGSIGTLVHNSCVDRAAAAATRYRGQALAEANHFRFPSQQAARQAASEIAGDLGREAQAIRLSEYRGAPWQMQDSTRVIGRQSADGAIGWRDDFLGHTRLNAGPHVNVWVDGIQFHLWYNKL